MKYILFPFLLFSIFSSAQISETDQELKEKYNQRAYECAYIEDYACALEYFSKVVALFSSDSLVYLDRGFIKEKMGDYKGAIDDFSKQIAIDNSNADNYFLRAECEDKIGEYGKAIKDYTIVCKLDNGNADSFYFRGINRMRLKEMRAALKDFNKAISIAPEIKKYYLSRAELYQTLGKKRKANKDFIHYFQLTKKKLDKSTL